MDKEGLIAGLQSVLKEKVLVNEPMSAHTTWKIGGPADIFVLPGNERELASVLALAERHDVPWLVVGNGSNLLVGDKGVRGIVIKLADSFSTAVWKGLDVQAGAGMLLGTLALEAAERSAAGLEFARGIPGSLGGAIRMNAGAYGYSLSDLVTDVTVVDMQGNVSAIPRSELTFDYRESSLFRMEAVVTRVGLRLQPGDREDIMQRMKEYQRKRGHAQPLEFPSCGSVFRNPPNDHAGHLVEMCGLKGTRIGNAQVSPKHGNFIVNLGGASAADVRELIEQIQKGVCDYTGVQLEPEVRFIGEF
ncbi:MAG: UDP-N-acetylmuramate dehydrogenase [Firmicutes bacterium]|nr:UDP-N-acetylmuramate dehydrogenase [Bacillota bacterium]